MSEMLAIELYESLTQAGTDEDSLVEVLLSRSNNELNVISNDFLTSKTYFYWIFDFKKYKPFFLIPTIQRIKNTDIVWLPEFSLIRQAVYKIF